MIFPLPLSDFRWLVDGVEAITAADDADTGYILEVDLEYPAELHDHHNSYPLAAERFQVTDDLLSPYCADLKHN